MPRETKECLTRRGVEIMKRIHKINHDAYLWNRYHQTQREECHCCGTFLDTMFDEPLSNYFVMDIQGNFYCTECESRFEDGDERIYVEE